MSIFASPSPDGLVLWTASQATTRFPPLVVVALLARARPLWVSPSTRTFKNQQLVFSGHHGINQRFLYSRHRHFLRDCRKTGPVSGNTNHHQKWYFSGEVVFGCGKAIHGRGNALNRVLGKGQDGLTLVSPNGAAILGTGCRSIDCTLCSPECNDGRAEQVRASQKTDGYLPHHLPMGSPFRLLRRLQRASRRSLF